MKKKSIQRTQTKSRVATHELYSLTRSQASQQAEEKAYYAADQLADDIKDCELFTPEQQAIYEQLVEEEEEIKTLKARELRKKHPKKNLLENLYDTVSSCLNIGSSDIVATNFPPSNTAAPQNSSQLHNTNSVHSK